MATNTLFTTSWDDGHPLDSKIADLLVKYGLKGTFYIPIMAERAMMIPDQVRQLAAIFEVGAHTLNHVELTVVSDQVAKEQIYGSKQRIEDITSKPCTMFSFPRGRYRKNHLSLLREAGYKGVRTVELMSLEFPRSLFGIAVMPATVQAFSHTRLAYYRNLAKRLAWKNLLNYVSHGSASDWVLLAEWFLSLAIQRGGAFHLWGHSWEIDECQGWHKLEQILKMMSEYRSMAGCVSNSELCNNAELH